MCARSTDDDEGRFDEKGNQLSPLALYIQTHAAVAAVALAVALAALSRALMVCQHALIGIRGAGQRKTGLYVRC
jgi:hypothetical protein